MSNLQRTAYFSHARAEAVARAALDRVDPVRLITRSLRLQDNLLVIEAEGLTRTFDLARFDEIMVVGAGKAGASMARGLEEVLGDRISRGLVSIKYGHRLEGAPELIPLIEAGHPVPDEKSLQAAREIARLVGEAGERTLCITLISGGGSSLLTLPGGTEDGTLSLEDIQATTSLLLGAGTPIGEINCVRKHLSGISGGRFCRMAAPATVVALILSDVVGDDPGSIASGLAAADPTTFHDAWEICQRYGIAGNLPRAVQGVLQAGKEGALEETPKPGDPIFGTVHPVLLGTNRIALEAARRQALDAGYNTRVLTSRLTGEAREIARVFTALAAEIVQGRGFLERPACILAGGETTVTLRGSGKGGRNQEMALAVLAEMAASPGEYQGVTFLSAGTDGTDGPTDAAGAWASPDLAGAGDIPDLQKALAENDSYHLFERLGGLYITGPTNTNVCDIQILLVE
ncbi:hydroxypyruvate reductase [Alkalispirochaeta americana]|uniref:Hydroxypyruvate reductase n=1 Tax=Alkalispirochaeta americana TaxID=159291 RepID=A0A1N6RJK2_9SPIO|nr:glycerate kinase [Alkalispirochaeta americana]SIQ29044.1 hydroxypyruvate reductase [Alkalispirochaeta americana]